MQDYLKDGSTFQIFYSGLNRRYFLDVNKELCQTVENQLSFINENIHFILKVLFAIFFHLFWHSSTEHHHLLLMRSFYEDILNMGSHFRVAYNLIALVDDEEFTLSKKASTFLKLINFLLQSSESLPGVPMII